MCIEILTKSVSAEAMIERQTLMLVLKLQVAMPKESNKKIKIKLVMGMEKVSVELSNVLVMKLVNGFNYKFRVKLYIQSCQKWSQCED